MSIARPILVVGASGQLGGRVVQQLARSGRRVRAMVRPTSKVDHLKMRNVDLVQADLTQPASLDAACRNAGAVIATATAVAPTHGSTFKAVDDQGYASLLDACVRHECGRFVLVSVPLTVHDAAVPLFRVRRLIETRLAGSGLEHAVLRAAPFMDDWFALIGSRLPLRGDPAPLTSRPWPFLQTFVGATGQLIDQKGIALVPGKASTRQAFIAIDDVATALIAATTHAKARNAMLDLAGPELLSWGDVAALYAQVLSRPVRVVGVPGWTFRTQQLLMQAFSESAANIMGLNWLLSKTLPGHTGNALAELGIKKPITASCFLQAKAKLPV